MLPKIGNSSILEDINCKICFDKSFASHEKSEFWSKKNGKNPRDILKSSHINCWFDCHVCNHPFDNSLDKIKIGRWCPYCSHTMLCDELDCDFCYDKSFASHEKSKCWSKKNTKNPRNVFKSTTKKYWFDCYGCKPVHKPVKYRRRKRYRGHSRQSAKLRGLKPGTG